MITLEKIRADMKDLLTIDKTLHDVNVQADSIDEALADAAVQLDTKAMNLEYEVVEKGSAGFLGMGKKPWLLRIYQNPATIDKETLQMTEEERAAAAEAKAAEEKEKNRDGQFFVRRFGTSLMLKVTLPEGKGNAVDVADVLQTLHRSDTTSLDESLVKKFVQKGTAGNYEEVGEYNHAAAADASIVLDISNDEMKATITATAPGIGGADVSLQMIERALKWHKINIGIENDKIAEFIDNPVFDVPYEIAAGTEAKDGADAYIKYDFETDPRKIRAKEDESGQIDFKQLNRIQNVIKGGRLAQKIPAEKGRAGKTLTGKYIEAKNGKDIPIPLGQNVSLASDGLTVISDIDGQATFTFGKINVEPVLELRGVNIKTGNIKFLGTVIVQGNVEDGFSVEASGNIEVSGTIGNCKISSGGNIMVQKGIFGKDEGTVTCKKSLWAKFIQAAKVQVEDFVIVTDSIMNSEIVAMHSIVLNGKKAQIIGGHLFATEEIAAKSIGSVAGTETILEVGLDPRAKRSLQEFQEKQGVLIKELENIELDISTLENQMKMRHSLPKEKEENYKQLNARRDEINTESEKISEEIKKLQEHLRDLKAIGKVKASGTVYAGVKVYVRDVLDEVHNDVTAVTFYYDNSFVKRGKYEPPAKIKGLEGYATD